MKKEEVFEKGEKASSRVAIVVLFFAIAKAVIGLISGSVVLLSDAIHSAGDVVEISLVWLGFKISRREPTEKFPYGFYKVENFIALIVSLLILYIGFEIAQESYGRIFTIQSIKVPLMALGIAVFDAFSMFFLGKYEERVGKEINSQSLIADGEESKTHIFSSSLVAIGILASHFSISRIEGIIGLLLSLLVFKVGAESLKSAFYSLIDVSPGKEVEAKIKEALENVSGIEDFSALRLRKSGPFIFGEVNVQIKKFLDIGRAHEISDETERQVKEQVPEIDSILIHTEPLKKPINKIIIPAEEERGKGSKIGSHFGRAPFFAVLTIEKKKIKTLGFKKNPFQEKEVRAGLSVVNLVLKEEPDMVITKEIGPISLHSLRDGLVEVYKTKSETIEQAMESFYQEKLISLKKATREKK